MTDVMSRDQTLEFLQAHVKAEMLMKHLYAVEAVSTILLTLLTRTFGK
jgi:predicted hydrolase (HD superfamily)